MKDLRQQISRHIEQMQELQNKLRQDIHQMQEPRAQALYETTAEVLGGLVKAFSDFQKKNEEAWKK